MFCLSVFIIDGVEEMIVGIFPASGELPTLR